MYPILKRVEKGSADFETTFSIPTDIVVTKVMANAFRYAPYLKEVKLLDNVEVVEDYAFANTNIYAVYLGKSITRLGTKLNEGIITIFSDCSYLSSIMVDDNNANYANFQNDGILYSKDLKTIYKYPAQKRAREFYVPEQVEYISASCFEGASNIQRIVISSNLKTIGQEAFYNCAHLLAVYFKDTDAPIVRKATSPNAFHTGNDNTYIFYTTNGYEQNSANWDAFIQEYEEEYNIAECKIIPDLDNYNAEKYYAIVVVDKLGLPINGIRVKLTLNDDDNAQNNICDSDDTVEGIRILTDNSDQADGFIIDYSKSYTLSAVDQSGEYFPMENTEFYLDEATRITYITLSSVPTVNGINAQYQYKDAGDLGLSSPFGWIEDSGKYVTYIGGDNQIHDINSQKVTINKWCVNKTTILINCGMDINVNVIGIRLVQNGKEIKTVTDPEVLSQILTYKSDNEYGGKGKRFADLWLSIETERLEVEQDIYAIVDFSDGNQVQSKLNIQVINFEMPSIDMSWATNKTTIKVNNDIPLIGGSEISISPGYFYDKSDFHFGYGVGADYFRLFLDYGLSTEDPKNPIGEWEKYINEYKSKEPHKFHKNVLDITFEGYADMKYKGTTNGVPDFDLNSSFSATMKYTYKNGLQTVIVFIPVRVEFELTLEGEITFELSYDDEANKLYAPNVALTFTGGISAYAGVGCKLASAGVYGNITTVILLNVIPDFEPQKWTMTGELGFYVKYSGLFVKFRYEKALAKGKWTIFDNTNAIIEEVNALSIDEVYDESNYEIATSTFNPDVMAFSLQGIQEERANAYAGIDPKMIQVGDLVYIVYQDDLNGYSDNYDAYNYQKIVYQTYNTKTDEFSDVFVLDDNGYADGEYEVYYDGTDAVIVYTQLNKKLTTDNIDDMAGYVGALEVKTAVLCNGIFEASTNTLTSDEYYDMNLRVGEVDEKITVAWVQNAENSMFGTTENNNMSIWFSIYNGKTWSEPACLKSNINTITDIEVGENGVVYITDTNNDLTTIGADKTTEGYSDRLITVLDMDGNVTLLTAEEAAYHDVSYFADEIVYYMGNNLYSIDTNAAYFDVAIAELTEDYTVLTDAAGNVKAVLFVNTVVYDEETDADGSNVFAIFCDGDKWGSPIQLTDFGEEVFVSAFDAIDFEDKMLVSVLLSEVEYSEEATDEYDNYTTTNRFETLWFEYPTDYVMDEVTFDYESISLNGETTLTIPITNNGYKTINEVPVSIIRNGSEIVAETVSQFYNAEGVALTGGLLSGTSGYIKVTFNVGEADNALLYTVNVNGQTQDVQLWYSDFAVFGKQVLIGDTYHIVTRVTNNGYVSAAYTLTATLSGTEIYSQLTDELGYGETQYFTIPLECTLVGDGSDLVFVKVNADDEYMFSNNEAKINIAANEILTISTNSLSVWLSKTSATIDRTNLQDVELSFDETYTLVSATINDTAITELYSVSNSIITLDANALALKYGNGTYTIRFQFSDGSLDEGGNAVYKYATLALTVTQTFIATWVVDGAVVGTESYEIGDTPAREYPQKQADAQYSYKCEGWDSNGDGMADEITGILTNTTYVAVFSNSIQSYKVIWVVNGVQSAPQTYDYGSIPSYGGETVKSSDAQYDYVFAGWDNEVSAVTKNITYTAVFDAVVRKYNVTTIVDGVSSTSQVEYGSTPILTAPTKDSDVQYHYNFTGWTPEVSTVYGNQTYTAQFERTLRQYVVTWVVDGKETQVTYDYGTVPVFGDPPTKQGDKQYSYSFTGWDKELSSVNGDITYTAQFNKNINRYSVSFVVDGSTYTETYEYGATPSYTGDTSKPNDDAYRYAFSGWDKEIVAVSEDMTYVAQYTAVLIGSATVSNTTFKTAWNCEFTTTISLDNVQNMSSTVFTINYNAWLVKLKSYVCCEGTRVIEEDEGYITVEVDGLSNAVSNNIISLTFVTSDYAPIGESDFIYIVSEDKFTSNVGKLTLYQMGDVNMDGRVNTVDASMIQRYAVKKLELDDVQKVYANVNGDRNMDGSLKVNTIDASMIQRYAVKKINELGNRITVTFIDGEEIVSLTLVKGSELNYEPADGYKWSLAEDRFVSVDFTTLTSDTTVYMVEQ